MEQSSPLTLFPTEQNGKKILDSGSYLFHRFQSQLNVAPPNLKSKNEVKKSEAQTGTRYDVFLQDGSSLTRPNGGYSGEISGISLFVSSNEVADAFKFAHQKLQKNGAKCFTSCSSSVPHSDLTLVYDRNIPLDMTDRRTIAAHVTLYPPNPTDVNNMQKIARCENNEARWSLCGFDVQAEEIDLNNTPDPHLDMVCILLETLIINPKIDPNLKFEAAIYQYIASTYEQYFVGSTSIFHKDYRFHFILNFALEICPHICSDDESILIDIKHDNQQFMKSNLLIHSKFSDL